MIGANMTEWEKAHLAIKLAEQATAMANLGLYSGLADQLAALAAELLKEVPGKVE